VIKITLLIKNKLLLRFPFTFAAVIFAIIVVLAALIGHVNVIEIPIAVMDRIERDEIDEFVTAFMLVVVALVVDSVRTARRGERPEQLRVVHVTMRTVQDIVNNCLNQIQLLRLDAEGLVPEES
jgi:SNF family Na+-dependent transporter